MALSYWTATLYLTALVGAYFSVIWVDDANIDIGSKIKIDFHHRNYDSLSNSATYILSSSSPRPGWHFLIAQLYHLAALPYMLYIIDLARRGPLGSNSSATCTLQSWMLLTLRHGLAVLVIIMHKLGIEIDGDNDKQRSYLVMLASWLTWWAEVIRFPAACSATMTFVVWNGLLAPVIYCFGMKTPDQKQKFWNFITTFRSRSLHLSNIFLAWFSCGPWFTSSPHPTWPTHVQLTWLDLYRALVSVIVYMALYTLVFDRCGIHLYPIFSPRIGSLVLLAWTSMLSLYLGTFLLWRRLLATTS